MQADIYDVVLAQLYSKLQPPNADPLSIEVLAAALEKHCPNCRIHLITVNPATNPHAEHDLLEVVSSQNCKLLGLSVPQGTYDLAIEILGNLNKISPSKRPTVVLGHALPTYMPEVFLQPFPWAIAVRGWGEEALVTLVQMTQTDDYNLQKVPSISYVLNGVLVQNMVRNQISPQPPKRIQGEFFPRLETSRGCHYGVCTFCTRPPGDKRFWKRIPVDTVLASIQDAKDRGYSYFTFADEDFIGNDLEGAFTIAKGIAEIGGMNFSLSVRADNIINPKGSGEENEQREAVLRALMDAGLSWVFIGFESLSDDQLHRYGKGIRVEDSLKAAKLIKTLNLEFEVGFILFDPLVSVQDLQNTVDVLRNEELDLWRNVGHLFSLLRVQKATGYETWLSNKGLLKQLDPDILSYKWDFQDQNAALVARACLTWAKGIDPVYKALRNIERTDRNHRIAKDAIDKFRKLDLNVLDHAVKQVSSSLPKQEIAISKTFYNKRWSLVNELTKNYIRPAHSQAERMLICEIDQFLSNNR
jgi:radical SAM superfamily enzyme YgiQ (UPF0313 family)